MEKISVSAFVIALWLCYTLRTSIVSAGESLQEPGDAIIGALVSVHQKESGDSCVTPDLHGILTVEAILFALKAINEQNDLTLRSKLGCDIRDTCPSPVSAALDLVVNSRRPKDEPLVAAVGDLPQQLPENHRALLMLFSSQTLHMSCITSTYKVKYKPDLISRTEFIFHAVARDRSNLKAMVHLAAQFNWTYVGVVYDDSAEGKYEADLFQQEAEDKFVCVGRKYPLASNASGEQIQNFISSLKADKNFSVVVMLTSKRLFKGIIDEAFKQKISDVTWIGGESSWDNEAKFPTGNTAAQGMFKVGTSASIVAFKAHLQDLLKSSKLNKWIMNMVASAPVTTAPDGKSTIESTTSPPTQAPVVSSAQPNSSSYSTGNTTTPLPSTPAPSPSTAPATPSVAPTTAQCNDKPCGVNKTLLAQLVNTLKSMADSATCTIDSIFAVAHALSAKEKCKTNCPEDHDFYKFIKNVNFTSLSGHKISFNSQRNLNDVEYKIWTLQKTGNGSAMSVQEQKHLQLSFVGRWKQSGQDTPELMMRPSAKIKWNTNEDEIPKSACHDPCKPGTYKALKETRGEAECCWHCVPCPKNSISEMEDSSECKQCPAGSAASNVQDECITQFENYVYWSDAGSLIMLFVMVAGVCFSVYVAVVLFKNRETPVMRRVKNATLLLLPFVVILFLIPIPLLSKPNEASCEGYRAFFILTLGIPLASLISKSVFVDNRYYDSDGQVKESWGQCICTPRLAFAIGSFTIHVIATILIAVLLPNEILRYPTDDPFTVYIECSIHTGFGFLVVIFYIMAVTTVYSIMSMNEEITPENDMEVRWTSFCMFIWYVISFLYVAIEYGAVGKGKIFGLAFVDFLFAVNILACIYLPKWYVIVFQPEKNQADVSPWSMYVKTQEKVSVRLSEGEQESPVLPKRDALASMAKESGKMSNGDSDMDGKSESTGLINDTDV